MFYQTKKKTSSKNVLLHVIDNHWCLKLQKCSTYKSADRTTSQQKIKCF